MSRTADSINSIVKTKIQDISIEDGISGMDLVTCFNFEPNTTSTQTCDIRNHDIKMIKWHIRLKHLPFSKLWLMASMGMIS